MAVSRAHLNSVPLTADVAEKCVLVYPILEESQTSVYDSYVCFSYFCIEMKLHVKPKFSAYNKFHGTFTLMHPILHL